MKTTEPKTETQIERRRGGGVQADVFVIGAGPTGLASAIEAQRIGLNVVVIDKGCLVNSIYHYPANMIFFTTPELLEIGDIPFTTSLPKPTRAEALEYYRNVADHYKLKLLLYERVERIAGHNNDFTIHTTDRFGDRHQHRARKLIISTGYYDLPNLMKVPGEDLPKVRHYYDEPHPYYDTQVMIVGGKNSAAIAALELWRHGAHVTLVHRGPGMHANVKYWIKPDIENRIKNGEVKAYFDTRVIEITPATVQLERPDGAVEVANDFVFALTGYHPDYSFLRAMGIELSEDQCRPLCDPQTLESNVPGIYVAGVIVAGSRTSEIFIENGRFHGRQIAEDLKRKCTK